MVGSWNIYISTQQGKINTEMVIGKMKIAENIDNMKNQSLSARFHMDAV